jgi:hypothetical protein
MPCQNNRRAWLKPLDTHEPTLLLPHWKDLVAYPAIKAYSAVALGAVSSAALLIGLGFGRPRFFIMLAVAHCVVAALVVAAYTLIFRTWRRGKAQTRCEKVLNGGR